MSRNSTSFKLDQIPSEIITEVFRYAETLDMGVLLQICKGFNQILEITPSLWRFVELDEETPGKSAFKIIKTFAERSNHTLVSIKTPEEYSDEEWKQVMSLLERSKATLRRLDIISNPPERDADSVNLPPSIRFFNSFPNLERLNLTDGLLPEAGRIPGVLTMFGSNYFFDSIPWSQEELKKVSSLQALLIQGQTGWSDFDDEEEEGELVDNLHVMTEVFKACSQNLTYLSIETYKEGPHELDPIEYSLPKLTSLKLIGDGNFSKLLNCELSSVTNLEISTTAIKHLKKGCFNNLRHLRFIIELDDSDSKVDWAEPPRKDVEGIVQLCLEFESTLTSINFNHFVDQETFDINQVLKSLDVDRRVGTTPYPSLTDLYLSGKQIYSPQRLAMLVISRNLEATSSLKDGKPTCSVLTPHLHPDHREECIKAQEELISTITRACGRLDC